MSDLISRQAVLDGIAEWIVSGYADSEADCSHISSLVTHLPSVENKGEWIPVGWIPNGRNGYPSPEEEYKHFLTIDNKGEMTVQQFLLSLDEEPMPYFTGMRNIVAWMPLPTPYKERGD